MNKLDDKRRGSRGQMLVLFAVAVPGLMVVMALGVDAANLFSRHQNMQGAADLSALAGARHMPADPATAESAALAVAGENGYSSGVAVIAPYVDQNGDSQPDMVEVRIAAAVPTFFMPILGVSTVDVGVRAVAGSSWTATGGTFPAVFAGCGYTSDPCSAPKDKAIDWSGSDGNIIGGIHSNCGILVGGQNNSVEGDTTYSTASECGFDGGGNTYDPAASPSAPVPFPVDYTAASFACDVTVNGKLELKNYYESGTKNIRDGVYCATGSSAEILLDEQGVSGNVTLVADRGTEDCSSGTSGGKITISGSDFSLTAYDPSKVLMYSNGVETPTIVISGSNGTWNGLIIARCGQAEISGQSVGTSGGGSILANTVKIGGSDVVIDSNGLSALGPPTLEWLKLFE
ncbi:MAG TPA: pilus assembly protein TadG-related protein [Candidatus Limnocylindria bacterium]|nr:pilus assembly protein TadG-related protein [Candidatus Limnocylindria bacterium]